MKRDISRRRLQSRLNAKKGNKREKQLNREDPAEDGIEQKNSGLERLDIDRVAVDHFTAQDRRRILHNLMMKEEVFSVLYDKLFQSEETRQM